MTNWTQEQSDIIEAVAAFDNNILVNAVAGSGKTTVLVESANRWSKKWPALSGFACAFNKDIAKTLQARLPKSFVASTLHSHGYKALKKAMGSKIKLDKYKFYFCADEVLGKGWDSEKEMNAIKPDIRRGVALLKTIPLIGEYTESQLKEKLEAMLAHQGISFEKEEQLSWVIESCIAIFEESLHATEQHGIIDFDDMLFEPVNKNAKFDQHALVMLDECQDVSPLQLEIVRRSIINGGKLLAVGDRNQAIYGWRGADDASVDRIVEDFECKELPMTYTFRCPELIVKEAQRIVPHIKWAPGANLGDTFEQGKKEFLDILEAAHIAGRQSYRSTAMLCRNRKPLISMAFRMRRRGVKAVVLGSDLGANLCNMIMKWKVENAMDIERKAAVWRDSEMRKARDKNNFEALAAIEDKADCLISICQNVDSSLNKRDVMEEIRSLFADEAKTPDTFTLSTIHKAKGLEWETVYFLMPELIPNKYCNQDWQFQQERNLIYVGVTRSLEDLIYVSPKFDKDDEDEDQ